jgi:hypothetical protein
LLALDNNSVTFKWKDYRSKGPDRYKAMTLAIDEFIRRFLIHVLPKGFHRIRRYGLFAKPSCADNVARAHQLLAASQDQIASADAVNPEQPPVNRCPCCGGCMIIIERFKSAQHRAINRQPRQSPSGSTLHDRRMPRLGKFARVLCWSPAGPEPARTQAQMLKPKQRKVGPLRRKALALLSASVAQRSPRRCTYEPSVSEH